MPIPNVDQEAVLTDVSRVRVIRAAPGSGKTWLIAELIRREFKGWSRPEAGIAALSFTRVGGEEIRRSLGHDLHHPHFVGTIDSFVFRYIVKPFYATVCTGGAPVRLLPAELLPADWKKNPKGDAWTVRGKGAAKAREYNPFDVCYLDSDNQGPVLATRNRYRNTIDVVPDADRGIVLRHKRDIWREYGLITHADAAYIASQCLLDAKHGAAIRREIVRRFPLLMVDELQDTGTYLAKCILALLREPESRGVLVGDPDQAIYEFNGARPDLFKTFEALPSAKVLPLPKSLRCPAAVAACASHLKDTSGVALPREGEFGRAIIIQYDDMRSDVGRLYGVARIETQGNVQVLARHTRVVELINGSHTDHTPVLYCPAVSHLQSAVRFFRQDRKDRALALASAGLSLALFGTEDASEERLVRHVIDPMEWRKLAIACLLEANALPAAQTLYDWQMAVGQILDRHIAQLKSPTAAAHKPGKLKPQKREGWDRQAGAYLPIPPPVSGRETSPRARTIHSAKGETHDVTIVVFPDSVPDNRCLSQVLWSADTHDREERRIAYVAMTRPRRQLILCVSKRCHERLVSKRPSFMASCMTHSVESYTKEQLLVARRRLLELLSSR